MFSSSQAASFLTDHLGESTTPLDRWLVGLDADHSGSAQWQCSGNPLEHRLVFGTDRSVEGQDFLGVRAVVIVAPNNKGEERVEVVDWRAAQQQNDREQMSLY